MDCENAGWSDDRAAVTFMMGFGESGLRYGSLTTDKRKWKTVGFEQGLQVKTPCAVERAIVGDGIADGHDLQRFGSVEVSQDHFRPGGCEKSEQKNAEPDLWAVARTHSLEHREKSPNEANRFRAAIVTGEHLA